MSHTQSITAMSMRLCGEKCCSQDGVVSMCTFLLWEEAPSGDGVLLFANFDQVYKSKTLSIIGAT